MFGHKMAHKLTRYSRDGEKANLIDYVILKRRLVGPIEDTRVYRSAFIDIKSKDHHVVVSKVNLKLKFRKGNYLPGSYEAGKLQDENLRETFHGQWNTKLESLKFDNVKDRWNSYRRTICEVADGFLGKKIRDIARYISENAICLNKEEKGLVQELSEE